MELKEKQEFFNCELERLENNKLQQEDAMCTLQEVLAYVCMTYVYIYVILMSAYVCIDGTYANSCERSESATTRRGE